MNEEEWKIMEKNGEEWGRMERKEKKTGDTN